MCVGVGFNRVACTFRWVDEFGAMSLGGRGAPAGAAWAGEFQGPPRERAGWADQFQAEHAPGAAWAEQYASEERVGGWANEFNQVEAAAVRPDRLVCDARVIPVQAGAAECVRK